MQGHLGSLFSVLYMDAAHLIAAALEISLPSLRHGSDLQIRIQTGPCVVLQCDRNIQAVSRLYRYSRIVRIQVQTAGSVNRMRTHEYQEYGRHKDGQNPKPLTCSILSDYHCFLHNFLLLPNGASVFSTSYHNVETFSQPLISLKIL